MFKIGYQPINLRFRRNPILFYFLISAGEKSYLRPLQLLFTICGLSVIRPPQLLCIALLTIGCLSEVDGNDDPFSGTPKSKNEKSWDSGSQVGWRDMGVSIDGRKRITSGGIGCPVLVSGASVISTKDFSVVANLEVEYDSSAHAALSADGTYFAVASKSPNQRGTSVYVFDTASGKKVHEIQGVEDEFIDLLLVVRNKYVATGGRSSSIIKVRDAKTGGVIKEFDVGRDADIEMGKVTFSSDGHYMAVLGDEQLRIFKVADSKVVAVMQPPSPYHADDPSERRSSNDHSNVYDRVLDIQFSPSGLELVAVANLFGSGAPTALRFLCWSQNAKLKDDIFVEPIVRQSIRESSIKWFPEENAWLFCGNLIDRKVGRVTMSIAQGLNSRGDMLVQDQNRLLGKSPELPNRLCVQEIPWQSLKKSLQSLENKEAAKIAPYQSVGIKLNFGETVGSKEAAAKRLTEAMENLLRKQQIELDDSAEDFFQLTFSERLGERARIYEFNKQYVLMTPRAILAGSAIVDRGRDTGTRINIPEGTLVLELIVDGKSESTVKKVLEGRCYVNSSKQMSQDSVRRAMLGHLSGQLLATELPFFLPSDPDHIALPVIR